MAATVTRRYLKLFIVRDLALDYPRPLHKHRMTCFRVRADNVLGIESQAKSGEQNFFWLSSIVIAFH
jgi:hypothetical protein